MTTAPSIERLPARLHIPRAAVLFLASGWIAIGVYFLIPAHPQDMLYMAIGVRQCMAIAIGSQKLGAERLAWRLFASGCSAKSVVTRYSSFYEIHLGREPPLPSLADIFYLGGYPLLALGILLLLRQRGSTSTRVGVLDTVIVFAAVATVQWMFLVEPYRHARARNRRSPDLDGISVDGRSAARRACPTDDRRRPKDDRAVAARCERRALDRRRRDVRAERREVLGGGWLDTLWLGSYIVWGAAGLALARSIDRAAPAGAAACPPPD